MKITPGKIQGTWFIEPNVFDDSRGNFHEVFKFSEVLALTGVTFETKQVNQSRSKKGVLRGIHWTESEEGQAKFVSCPQGAVWDVVVDLRPTSTTFGQWDAVLLSEQNSKSILIEKGLGHAFLALEDETVVNYLCSSEYRPGADRTVNPLSPKLEIDFQTKAAEYAINNFIMSAKDSEAPNF
jgi:dTDP-4-dehydrorhamnose 3,5-epimerase